MSSFRKDFEDKVKKSIKYFNSLPPEKQAFIVSNLLDLDELDEEKLESLFFAISNDISNYDETTIANKLFDLGLDKTYATLFVKNMIEQLPTMKYRLQELEKFNDEEFKVKFPRIVNEMFVERTRPSILTKEQDITQQQLRAILGVARNLMNSLARSSTSEKKIIKVCEEAKLSQSKIDTLINTLKINSEYWRNMVVFSNTQDAYFLTQDIAQQNEMILHTLQEILKLLKGNDSSNTQHFQ